jgi:Arc/MetJ-type ribon-helix-helix transcriptional regulator
MRTSVSLNDELTSYVDEVASSAGENDAEAIRETLRHAQAQTDRLAELEAENEQLQERVDALETELDRVRNEKRLLLEEREKKAELVKYVEQERTVEQRWREAGLATRLKWKVFGMDTAEATDS